MNKLAAINNNRRLYYACQAVLRTKYADYYYEKTTSEKRAYVNPLGIGIGAVTGATAGYGLGNWAANKFGWKPGSWQERAARWGGGLLGAVGGGVLGNFTGGWLGGAGNAAKGAATAANAGGGIMNTAKNALNLWGLFGGISGNKPYQSTDTQATAQSTVTEPTGTTTPNTGTVQQP